MRIGGGKDLGQAVAEEDVVAKHHRGRGTIKELLGQQISLRQTVGARLRDIGQRDAPLAAVAKRALELVGILRRGDDCDLADPAQH